MFVAKNIGHGCDDDNGFGGYNVGIVKLVEMELEDDDTCEEPVENKFTGGNSTSDIRFSSQMNLQL